MNKLNAITKKMVLLKWFNKSFDNLKFKYDVIDTNWVDVDSIISTLTMNYEKEKDILWLDQIDANSLNQFLINKIL